MSKKETNAVDRRDFFRTMGVGAGAAAVSLSAAAVQAAAPEETVSKDTAGYRETEHVKRYYELARF